jgi:hypothetical protein
VDAVVLVAVGVKAVVVLLLEVFSNIQVPFGELVILQFRHSELALHHLVGVQFSPRSTPSLGCLSLLELFSVLLGDERSGRSII